MALSCDFLPGDRLTGPAKSFVIWVSQGDDEESAVPVNGLVSVLGSGLVVGLAAREMIKNSVYVRGPDKSGESAVVGLVRLFPAGHSCANLADSSSPWSGSGSYSGSFGHGLAAR